ncbi:MAG: hypothetical protein KC503_39925 [Myxococcales bacterium]|nr:hypothetical protein [Myxococcales bacterium]
MRSPSLIHRALSFTLPLALLAAAPVAVTLSASPCYAQSDDADDVEKQAVQLFAEGKRLYGEGKLKQAVAKLEKAYDLRPAPPILLNIGKAYEKLGQKKKALLTYIKFLRKARLVSPFRPMISAKVKALKKETGYKGGDDGSLATYDTARTGGGSGSGGGRRRRGQMIHTPVDSVKVRQPLELQAELPPDAKADSVRVYFRRQGQTKFRSIAMDLQGDAYVARVPGKYVRTTSMQYYIEARNKGQKRPVAVAGTRRTPHIVVIDGGKPPSALPKSTDTIRSPYWTWFWVGVGVTAASLGAFGAFTALMLDRKAAIEDVAYSGGNDNRESFGVRARDWESQGKTFDAASKVFLAVGIAAAAGTGFLFYLDRKWVKRERARREADMASAPREKRRDVVRLFASPWATQSGAGFVGRIDF